MHSSNLSPPSYLTPCRYPKDAVLWEFLQAVRVRQPPKSVLRAFFAGRLWDRVSLPDAVRAGIYLEQRRPGKLFAWLTVTNKGSDVVCRAALSALGLDKEENRGLYPGGLRMPIKLVSCSLTGKRQGS